MSTPPTFIVDQTDGRQVLIDLSAPGAFGDFTFRATDLATDHTDYFDAYHTGEASIFLDVLHVLVHDRPRELVLDEIDRVRADVHARAGDMTPTTISENSLDPLLGRVIGLSDAATGHRVPRRPVRPPHARTEPRRPPLHLPRQTAGSGRLACRHPRRTAMAFRRRHDLTQLQRHPQRGADAHSPVHCRLRHSARDLRGRRSRVAVTMRKGRESVTRSN